MIPKIIHFCWLSGDSFPIEIEKYIQTWKEKLPDYEIRKWDCSTFNIDNVPWVKEAFSAKKYAFAADYIRFYALYNYGGIYLDSDVEVLKSFDDLLNTKSFIGFEYLSVPEAAIIGAEKGLPWLKKCLDYYVGKHFDLSAESMYPLPFIIKPILEEFCNTVLCDTGKIQMFEQITFYPYFYFSPKNYYTGKIEKSEKTYCVHHFKNSWITKKRGRIKLFLHAIFVTLFGKKLHDKLVVKRRLSIKK